jgi:hypothetical protein
MKAHELFLSWKELESHLNILSDMLDGNDHDSVRMILENLVNGYRPMGDIVDWIYIHNIESALLVSKT